MIGEDTTHYSPLTTSQSTSTLFSSPLFSFRGRAETLQERTSAPLITDSLYSFQVAMKSPTSSSFVLWGSTSTRSMDGTSTSTNTRALLTINQDGNLSIAGKLSFADHPKSGIWFDGTLAMVGTDGRGWVAKGSAYSVAFAYDEPLMPGDLVVLDTNNRVKRSTKAGENKLVGVVSDDNGFLAGFGTSSSYPVALSGRVRVKVSGESGSIMSGDLLAASDQSGAVAKQVRAGMIAGTALEDTQSGATSVLMAVSIGWRGSSEVVTASSSSHGTVLSDVAVRKGFAEITPGEKVAHVEFETLHAYPMVLASPQGRAGDWWIANQTDSGFDIILASAQEHDVVFSWSARATPQGSTVWNSDHTVELVNSTTGETVPGTSDASTSVAQDAVTEQETAFDGDVQTEPSEELNPPVEADAEQPSDDQTSEDSNNPPSDEQNSSDPI